MWQRFTERARRIIFFAQEEAGHRGFNEVRTEHLLLGTLRESDTVAGRLLACLGVKQAELRDDVRRRTEGVRGEGRLSQDMQLSAGVKRVISCAYEEAKLLKNNYIGTEHILLALVRDEEGIPGAALAAASVGLERLRDETRALQESQRTLLDGSEDKAPPNAPLVAEPNGGMWAAFTEGSRAVVAYAQVEAAKLKENYVSTEHLLLGLTRTNDPVIVQVFGRFGLSSSRIWAEITRQVAPGTATTSDTVLTLTPRSKRVIDLSFDEARRQRRSEIGVEHLLLGLIREQEGVAGRVLNQLGLTLDATRAAVILAQADNDAHELPPSDLSSDLSSDLATETAEPEAIRLGDLGVVKPGSGRMDAEIARTASAFLRLADVFAARDMHGYDELRDTRSTGSVPVVLLPAGTGLKRLVTPRDADDETRREAVFVRILSGDFALQTGFLRTENFERTGSDDAPFPRPASVAPPGDDGTAPAP